MMTHDGTSVDNLLLEWFLSIVYERVKPPLKSFKIYPIMIGAVDPLTDMVASIFDSQAIKSLPKVVPTATIALAKVLLRECGVPYDNYFDSMTVHSIVTTLSEYLGFKTTNLLYSSVVEASALKLFDLINKQVLAEEQTAKVIV